MQSIHNFVVYPTITFTPQVKLEVPIGLDGEIDGGSSGILKPIRESGEPKPGTYMIIPPSSPAFFHIRHRNVDEHSSSWSWVFVSNAHASQ